MTSLQLTAEPLTHDAFAPFGDVIEAGEYNQILPINYGLTERHHDLARLDVEESGGRAIVSIFRTQAIRLPFEVKIMERHPMGSQAFVMMTGNPYLVLVAPAGEFKLEALRAFEAQANQGVNYHKGVWHHYCMGLNETNEFLVIDRGGEGDNCDEVPIPDGITVTLQD